MVKPGAVQKHECGLRAVEFPAAGRDERLNTVH
jgi:hypothetical protein